MLISHLSHELEPPYDQDGKRTFFLVPTKPLVRQQAAEIVNKSRFTESDVGEYTGDMNVDYWSADVWLPHLRSKKILVMTRQIFLNLLNSAKIPLKKVNLLIFDEAHHAAPLRNKKKESKDCYKLIMNYIHSRPESEHPHILGLSASLLNADGNANALQQTIADLEETYKSTCTSVTDLDEVRKYASDPEQCIWQFEDGTAGFECNRVNELFQSSMRIFEEMLIYKAAIDKQKKKEQAEKRDEEATQVTTSIVVDLPIGVDALKKCFSIIKIILHSMGPWCAIEACDFYVTEFQNFISMYEFAYPAFGNILTTINDMLTTVKELIKYKFYTLDASFSDMLLKFSSNKMKRLLELLTNYNTEPIAGIIFVKRRAICKAMCKWLQKLNEIDANFEFLRTDYIVGEAARPGFANKIAVKAAQLQKESLIKFRRCEINLLVATSILEEGLDVSQCNLVVRYDGVDTYREWVQSQGRARARNGRFVIFSESGDLAKTEATLMKFKDMAQKLQIECQNVNRTNQPTVRCKQVTPDDEMPLIDPISGATVTIDTAKAIVFMYCNRLPSDAFFTTNPYETINESSDGFQCSIRLPINSPLNQAINGPVKDTESKACKAAYLKVCRTLREHEEIDETFVPYSKKARLKKIIEEFNLTCSIDEDEECLGEGSQPEPGPSKRRRLYSKSFQNMFADLPVTASTLSCLYSINVQPKTGAWTVGFICSKHVPFENIVASFPVYIKTDEYKISVTAIDTAVKLSSHQLHQVQSFHRFVFNESLGFKRQKLTLDETSSVYVVPLNGALNVDWDMIQQALDRNNYNMATNHDEKRQQLRFNGIDYTDALVYRWYDPVGLFEVFEVKNSTTSRSRFPNNNEQYKTYRDYYMGKYGLQIIHPTYPLLSVDPIGNNSSIKRTERTKAERKRKPIELVPELVTIFPIPTSFHRQCRLLPAIFYRLCELYNVERLRERLAREANIGLASLPSNHSWGILNFDCDKSNCPDEDTIEKNEQIVDAEYNSESDSDNCHYGEVGVNDADKMETESESSILEIMPHTQRMPMVSNEPSSAKVSDIYGDTNALKLKYSNFNADTYSGIMRTRLCQQYQELLHAPLYYCDLGNHSQYLAQNDATRKAADVDFNRVKSFDVHTEPHIIGPTPSLLLQALTTKKAIDTFNMERLETLGDSFLKLTTSAYFYYKLPLLNEGLLTSLKVNQISNYNLYRLGKLKGLAEHIVAHQFQASNNWLPPGFCVDTEPFSLEKKQKNDERSYDKFVQQEIGDKSVADCCESLIGAYLLSSGPRGAVKFMTWLGLRIMDPMTIDNNDHWLPLPRPGQSSTRSVDSESKIRNLSSTLTGFEDYINYSFRDKCYLIQAMTHVSYHDNTVTDCYQRLEFLGDAVLDYIVTRYIYEDPKRFAPGELTDLRAALTNNSFFGSLAVQHNFHVHLKITSYELYRSIHSFADKFKENGTDIVYGNFLQLLGEREVNTLEETDIPKALGDVFEAVAGAIYLDCNYSLDAVWQVYYPLMKMALG